MSKSIVVGELSGRPGELKYGYIKCIELSDRTEVKLPVMIMMGEKSGPTLLLTAQVHGQEMTGAEVIRRLLREKIKPSELSGNIIAIPVANPLAVQYSQR